MSVYNGSNYFPTLVLAMYNRSWLKGNKNCDNSQCTKSSIKYVKFMSTFADEVPYNNLCVNLAGPYKILRRVGPPLILKAINMLDPVMGWFKIMQYDDKKWWG